MLEHEKSSSNMYITTINNQLDIQKICIIILIIIVTIGLIMVTKNSVEIMKQHKVYEQYEAQVIALKKQEEDKKAAIEREKEKIREEKTPKLTQKRKRQYGKHLSF